MAKVTMESDEYHALIDSKKAAEEALAVAQQQICDMRLSSNDPGVLRVTTKYAREALTIVRFAVGNLPPETTRNWPVEALRQVGVTSALPDFDGNDDIVLGDELLRFADEIDAIDRRRATRKEAQTEIALLAKPEAPEAHNRECIDMRPKI